MSKDRVPLRGKRTNEGGKAASDLGFRLQAGGKALRHRNFQLFFGGQLISLVGTWMQSVAQSWLVYRLTGSGLLLGSVGFVSQIPVFLVAPLGGIAADRLNRQRIVIATQVASMLLACVLAGLTQSPPVNSPRTSRIPEGSSERPFLRNASAAPLSTPSASFWPRSAMPVSCATSWTSRTRRLETRERSRA